jgi:hypothetical protein
VIIQTRYGTISMVMGYCWSHLVPKRRMDGALVPRCAGLVGFGMWSPDLCTQSILL